jgi:hypothetical protein
MLFRRLRRKLCVPGEIMAVFGTPIWPRFSRGLRPAPGGTEPGKTSLRLFRKAFATSAVPFLEIRNEPKFIFGRSSCQIVRRLGY